MKWLYTSQHSEEAIILLIPKLMRLQQLDPHHSTKLSSFSAAAEESASVPVALPGLPVSHLVSVPADDLLRYWAKQS